MKRFHVHLSVDDLASSIRFYSSVFAAQPTVLKDDYAKWMLDDPRLNFAISKRARDSAASGLNHLGLQVESEEELQAMHGQLQQADRALLEQMDTACCYARSDKYWVTDPQGIAWETFHTLGHIPVFGAEPEHPDVNGEVPVAQSGCCVPAAGKKSGSGKSSCC